jgi:hypothetical protein
VLHGIADRLHQVQRRDFYELGATIRQVGPYCHDYGMSIAVACNSPPIRDPRTEAEVVVIEALRDLTRWLYSQHEAEHDHLNADAQADEGVVGHRHTFTEAAPRFG